MSYTVNFWGSRPGTNDDCWTGVDFSSLPEAQAALAGFLAGDFGDTWLARGARTTAWFELDGPDFHLEVPNPRYVPSRDDDSEWRREMAMEAGMAFGCQGYNDYMGY